ncbi:MAG: TetR/AcrR family transcriptional regulator [Novosphingobium sp.]|nr:TetR/AcrR family transcriptional regulator [Novosphingobium sp.]
MGPKGGDVWNAMLDAAEIILTDEGYGALTSRRVAEQTGVKQRLIYYYFRTMDELIVDMFRRLKARDLERLSHALDGDHGLRVIWDVCANSADTRIVQEFMALANRIELLKVDVAEYIELTRKMQVDALTQAMQDASLEQTISPAAAAIFATSAALAIRREAGIGVDAGHDDVMAVIEGFLARLDPED